jgi:hypothetical protein
VTSWKKSKAPSGRICRLIQIGGWLSSGKRRRHTAATYSSAVGQGADVSSREFFLAYLYRRNPVAFAYAFAGLRPADTRPMTGPPDIWLRLPKD